MAHLPHEQRSLNRSAALALLCALAAPGQAQQRIVTVAPSLTESVCALGHCSQIVGTDRYSTGPGPVAQLPKVGGLADASIEHIVALRPDLVLLGPRTRLDDRLKQLGIAVQTFNVRTHAEQKAMLRALGRSDELAHSSLRMTIGRWTTEAEIDYAIGTIRDNVAKLRELSPLWEMFKDGVDLSTIQWAAH